MTGEADLRDLYQEVILDHNKRPRNFRALAGANRKGEGYNPLCGDRLTLYLDIHDGVVKAATFEGTGCAISKASASMMTDSITGKTLAEVEQLFGAFHAMVTGDGREDAELGKLAVFAGVREFPSRVKCATLAWHTLRAALAEESAPATTE